MKNINIHTDKSGQKISGNKFGILSVTDSQKLSIAILTAMHIGIFSITFLIGYMVTFFWTNETFTIILSLIIAFFLKSRVFNYLRNQEVHAKEGEERKIVRQGHTGLVFFMGKEIKNLHLGYGKHMLLPSISIVDIFPSTETEEIFSMEVPGKITSRDNIELVANLSATYKIFDQSLFYSLMSQDYKLDEMNNHNYKLCLQAFLNDIIKNHLRKTVSSMSYEEIVSDTTGELNQKLWNMIATTSNNITEIREGFPMLQDFSEEELVEIFGKDLERVPNEAKELADKTGIFFKQYGIMLKNIVFENIIAKNEEITRTEELRKISKDREEAEQLGEAMHAHSFNVARDIIIFGQEVYNGDGNFLRIEGGSPFIKGNTIAEKKEYWNSGKMDEELKNQILKHAEDAVSARNGTIPKSIKEVRFNGNSNDGNATAAALASKDD